MAFRRHMLYPFAKQFDWQKMLDKKQKIIDKANIKENSKRKFFDYKEGDLILILNKQANKGKLDSITLPEGPWRPLKFIPMALCQSCAIITLKE